MKKVALAIVSLGILTAPASAEIIGLNADIHKLPQVLVVSAEQTYFQVQKNQTFNHANKAR